MGRRYKRVKIDGRTYKGTLDKFLADKDLKRKSIAKDGSCLFRAVSEQVYSSQSYHQEVRLKCVDYIGAHRDDFKEFITISLEEYLARLSKELWGGEVELVVLSRLYNRSIIVYNELSGRKVQEQVFFSLEDEEKGSTTDELVKPILLAYSDGNHYDSVYSIQYMDNLAFCQGILYTLLMEGVFHHQIPPHCKKKLMNLQDSDMDSIIKYRQDRLNPKDNVFYNLCRHYAPEEIKAMSWTLHYNVALLVHKREKECIERKDRNMAASIQFWIGDKCYFTIDGKQASGEIASLNTKPGLHLIHVYHLNESEQWEIPAKDITLVPTQSSLNHKRSRQRQNQSGDHANTRNYNHHHQSSGGNRFRQHKDRTGPVLNSSTNVSNETSANTASSQSIPNPLPNSTSSNRKSKSTAASKEGHKGSQEPSKSVSAATQQGQKTKSWGKSTPPTRNGGVDLPQNSSNSVQSGSATVQPASLSTSDPPTKTPPYSSVVKKTGGGPSGSLTSEGTEYESSGEEGAQEAVSNSFPTQHQQHQQQSWQSSAGKVGQGVTATLKGDSRAGRAGQGVTATLKGDSRAGRAGQGVPASLKGAGRARQGVTASLKGDSRAGRTGQRVTASLKGDSRAGRAGQGMTASLKGDGYSKKTPKNSVCVTNTSYAAEHPAMIHEESTPTQLSIESPQETTPIMSQSNSAGQESPYLERQIPREASSQPEDAWPLISDDHKESLPLAPIDSIPSLGGTMLFAAVMNNRTNQPSVHPTITLANTTTKPNFSFSDIIPSATSADRNAFCENFNIGAGATNPPPPPKTSDMFLPYTLPQSDSRKDPVGTGMSLMSEGLSSSNHQMRVFTSSPTYHQFIPSVSVPPVYVVTRGRSFNDHAGSEIYSNAAINKDNTPSHIGYSSSYSGSRTSGPHEHTTPSPFSTTMTGMLNMRGIPGGHTAVNQPMYSAPHSTGFTANPTSRESGTQTIQSSHQAKEIQVNPDVMAQGVQTVGLVKREAEIQTDAPYILVENLAPHEAQMESLGDKVTFAIKYSLKCLSLFSQASSHSVQELETSLSDLLVGDEIEQLLYNANQFVNLTSSSQQEFLSSVAMSDEHLGHVITQGVHQSPSVPLLPDLPVQCNNESPNAADFVRNEITPQQEQHLHSPGVVPPSVGMPPNYPMMMTRPPPFIMPHHAHLPMYYPPFMPHMPIPTPMGYVQILPHMIPRQVIPPTPPPPRMGDEVPMGDHQGPPFVPLDSAHQEPSIQDQIDINSTVDLTNPPPPLTEAQSEMLASLVSPVPIAEGSVPDQYHPPSELVGAVSEMDCDQTSRRPSQPYPVPPHSQSFISLCPPCTSPQHTDKTLPFATENDHSIGTAKLTHDELIKNLTPGNTQLKTTSPSKKWYRIHEPQTKPSKTSRKKQSADKGKQEDSTQPGLPCRPSTSQSSGSLASRPATKYSHDEKVRGQEEAQQKQGVVQRKLEHGLNHATVQKLEPEEPPLSVGEEGRKELTSKKPNHNQHSSHFHYDRVQRWNGKRHYINTGGDHTGSATVSGPSLSSSKSNQDSNRNIYEPNLFKVGTGLLSPNSNPFDTKDFKSFVPSPNADLDVTIDSSHGASNPTPSASSQSEKGEWPDFSDMFSSRPVSAYPVKSGSLIFVDHQAINDRSMTFKQYKYKSMDTQSIGSPFPLEGNHNSEFDNLSLSLSFTQNTSQYMGDLYDTTGRLHKH